jgi:Cys-tRNA(Pro) deacylase
MSRHPETAATRFLLERKIAFEPHLYDYEAQGGTRVSSAKLGVDEHAVVKTLVMEDDSKKPLLVLMHGDRVVSTKELARQTARKKVEPCKPDVAERHTGYLVGGTSPFGTRKAMPVYVEATILELSRILINGGRRGFLVAIDPVVLVAELGAQQVSVALER